MKQRPFLLQTRWVVGHVIIFLLVVLMVNLAFWQLRRLDARKELNAAVSSAMTMPAVDVAAASTPYQHVKVNGTWDPSHTFLVRYPLHLGAPGYYVVMPVILADGSSVLVNRGWIPVEQGRAMTAAYTAIAMPASIEGILRSPYPAGSAGTNGSSTPVVTKTGIDQRWVQLTSPVVSGDPVPLDPPDLSEGPHFSYALQWFAFSLIAIIGWGILLWRASRP